MMRNKIDVNVEFLPGDLISFMDQAFVVISNHGRTGIVESWPDRERSYKDFAWKFNGIACMHIGRIDL